MHELSVAENVVGIIYQYVPKTDLNRVRSVRMKIGELGGVVADSLTFCFQAITAQTDLSKASLAIEHIPFAVRCEECGQESRPEFGTVVCEHCGAQRTTVISGNELQVVDIDLDDSMVEVT
jgi:hydrogenase nickel incorporation protein HypA/HybF